MTVEEARADLMLAQADVFYRPKDDSIDMAIQALENQKSIIEELEKIWEEIRALPDLNPDYQMDRTIHISRYGVQEIIYKHIAELKGE